MSWECKLLPAHRALLECTLFRTVNPGACRAMRVLLALRIKTGSAQSVGTKSIRVSGEMLTSACIAMIRIQDMEVRILGVTLHGTAFLPRVCRPII